MIRVFLVDDHTVLRRGLRLLLADQPGLVVVGEAGNGLELLEQLPATPADVVLLDINVPGMDGEETTRRLHEQYPAAFVLAMSLLDSAEHILHIFDAGAPGYILKSAGLDEIVHGIRTVATERQFLCSELGLVALHKLCEGHSRPAGPAEKQGPCPSARPKCFSSSPKASPTPRLPTSFSPASAPSKPTARTSSAKPRRRTPLPSSASPLARESNTSSPGGAVPTQPLLLFATPPLPRHEVVSGAAAPRRPPAQRDRAPTGAGGSRLRRANRVRYPGGSPLYDRNFRNSAGKTMMNYNPIVISGLLSGLNFVENSAQIIERS